MRQQRFICTTPVLRGCLLAVVLVLCLLYPATFSLAQSIPAAGDKNDVWLMRKSGIDDHTVYHRSTNDPVGQLISVAKIEGRLALGAIAAGPEIFWIVKEQDGWVESLAVDNNPLPSLPRYTSFKPEQRLPKGLRPIAGAAATNGLWLLVSIDNQAKLDVYETAVKKHQASTQPGTANQTLPPWLVVGGLTMSNKPAQTQPADTQPAQSLNATQPSTQTESTLVDSRTSASDLSLPSAPTTQTVPPIQFPIYRVLQLQGSVWRTYLGPQVVGEAGPFAMLFTRDDEPAPQIFSQQDKTAVTRWVLKDGAWHPESIKADHGFDRAIVVDHQPVFAKFTKPSTVGLSVLSGNQFISLGSVELGPEAASGWAVLPFDKTIGVLEKSTQPAEETGWNLQLRRIDLMGQPQPPEVEELSARPLNFWNDSPNLVFFAGSLFIGLLLMWSLWGRDNVESSVRLPQGVVKADIPRRVFACLFDLLPCIWIAMLVYKVEFGELIRQLFELNKAWPLLKPWLFCVCLLAAYSTVCEAFYGRTLGKMLVGIRVTRLDGTSPGALQILIRNVIKIIEVLCFPLMFIPIARLNAQRLGDMAARTIVVTDEPEEEEEDDEDEEL